VRYILINKKAQLSPEGNKEYEKTYGKEKFFSSPGGGGGGGGKPPWKMIFIIFLLLGISIVVIAWFLGVGGLQASGGISYSIGQGIGSIGQSLQFRSLENWISNPFGMNPTAGQYEELQPAETPTQGPNQAFTLETRGFTSTVAINQPSVTLFIKVNNAGTQRISQLELSVDSGNYAGCLFFDEPSAGSSQTCADGMCGPLMITVSDIAPYSSKEVTVTGGKIDGTCLKNNYTFGGSFNPNQAIPFYIKIKGFTYYSTSSRLAIERIKTDYGVLLFQNNVLRQEKVGAIFQAGTALSINIDAGDQPILDKVNTGGLLMNWINNGAGSMPSGKNPFLFIVTPPGFGPCKMNLGAGKNILTDDMVTTWGGWNPDLMNLFTSYCNDINTYATKEGRAACMLCGIPNLDIWCSGTGITYIEINKSSPASREMFDWACAQRNKGANVCATNVLSQEFNVFTCDLTLPGEITTDENRHTDYVTAIAIYPYEVSAADVALNAYCTEEGTSECPR